MNSKHKHWGNTVPIEGIPRIFYQTSWLCQCPHPWREQVGVFARVESSIPVLRNPRGAFSRVLNRALVESKRSSSVQTALDRPAARFSTSIAIPSVEKKLSAYVVFGFLTSTRSLWPVSVFGLFVSKISSFFVHFFEFLIWI